MLNELCGNSYASVVAIECDDDNIDEDVFARDSERKCELIYDSVKEFASQSVFILIDLGSKACKQSVGRLINKEEISFIEIFEGKGDAESGKNYLASLLEKNKTPYAEEDFVLPEQEEYSVHEIVKVYKDIKKNSIKISIYRAYKGVETIKVEAPKSLSNGYDKLQSMVGLTEIKAIIDQIISAQKMNKAYLESQGHTVVGFGTYDEQSCDLSDFVLKAALAVAKGECDRGIFVDGVGYGSAMIANKVNGIYACVCQDPFCAQLAREHNDANVLCLGAKIIGGMNAMEIVKTYMKTEPLTAEKYVRRVIKVHKINDEYCVPVK